MAEDNIIHLNPLPLPQPGTKEWYQRLDIPPEIKTFITRHPDTHFDLFADPVTGRFAGIAFASLGILRAPR